VKKHGKEKKEKIKEIQKKRRYSKRAKFCKTTEDIL
jgi:hypothetical protein